MGGWDHRSTTRTHLSAARELGAKVDQLLAFAPTTVVLDLERVEFIDSLGVALLLRIRKGIVRDQGGTLEVVALSPAVRRVLDLCGPTHLFEKGDATPVT